MAYAFEAFADKAALMSAAAGHMAAALKAGLASHGKAAAALSGGSTPAPAYAALAAQPLDWPNVAFALVDERFVPPSDPGSNGAMLQSSLAPALARGAKLLPMWSDAPSAEAAALRAEPAYAARRFDVALLGMGADAHTASWFPNNAALPRLLDANEKRAVLALEAEGAAGASARLTLTFSALARCPRLILLITGAEKRAVLEAAATKSETEAPISAVINRLGDRLLVLWSP